MSSGYFFRDFLQTCRKNGQAIPLPLHIRRAEGWVYKGFTLFPLTGRSAGSMMEKMSLGGRPL